MVLETIIQEFLMELQKRHKADDETNHREVEMFREGTWQPIKWQSLTVGDIVKVYNNNFFPADLLLLSSRYKQKTMLLLNDAHVLIFSSLQ